MGRIERKRSSTLSGIFLRYVLLMLGLLLTLAVGIAMDRAVYRRLFPGILT